LRDIGCGEHDREPEPAEHVPQTGGTEHAACKNEDIDSPVVEYRAGGEVDARKDHPEDHQRGQEPDRVFELVRALVPPF
jgi:hypothetical protein